jgi:hypothetical protein
LLTPPACRPAAQLSAAALAEEGALEGQAEAQRLLAAAVARQIFGCLLLPDTPADAWLLAGLAGHLAGQYLRELLGPAELAHARHRERQVVAAGDDGRVAPLFMRPHGARVGAAVYGSTYGTEVGDGGGGGGGGDGAAHSAAACAWRFQVTKAIQSCRCTCRATAAALPRRCWSPARCASSRQWR